MALASNEIRQQMALGMMHDYDSIINRLTMVKSQLTNSVANLVSFGSTLDPDSPEMKSIEARRQKLAAYEKRIDQQIQMYQNQRKIAEQMYQQAGTNVDRAIQRFCGGNR